MFFSNCTCHNAVSFTLLVLQHCNSGNIGVFADACVSQKSLIINGSLTHANLGSNTTANPEQIISTAYV
jgi:hypothetical protein